MTNSALLLLLMVRRVGLQFVIVVLPDHTHFLYPYSPFYEYICFLFCEKCLFTLYYTIFCMGAKCLSGRVLDSRRRGCGFEPQRRHCIVSLSKVH